MDLLSIIRTIWRHKIAIIPAILITVIGVAYVAVVKPPEYEATATVVLIAPPPPPSPEQIAADPKLAKVNSNNPYVDFGDLSIVSDVVLSVVNSNASQQTLLSEGVDARSQAEQSPDSGAIIQVNGVGKTVPSAIGAADIISQLSISDLATLQKRQHVNPQYMITAIELVRPTQAKLVLSGKLRYLIAILAVGVILLFIAVSAAEAIESRRRGAPYPNGAARAWGDTGTGTNASDVAGGVGRLFGAGPLPSPRSGRKWQADANSRMTPRNPAQPRGGDRP